VFVIPTSRNAREPRTGHRATPPARWGLAAAEPRASRATVFIGGRRTPPPRRASFGASAHHLQQQLRPGPKPAAPTLPWVPSPRCDRFNHPQPRATNRFSPPRAEIWPAYARFSQNRPHRMKIRIGGERTSWAAWGKHRRASLAHRWQRFLAFFIPWSNERPHIHVHQACVVAWS